MAPEIKVGETPQPHNFHTPGDKDYVKFKVAQPMTYTIWTSKYTNAFLDTVLTLYDTNCVTITKHDDNNWPTDLFSTITRTITETGTYFAMVKHWDPLLGECGPDYWYYLQITATNSLSSLKPEGVAHLPPRSQMLWERTGIFLPVYWKEWGSLKRFRP
jgi:hypothetical protein